MVIYPKPYSVYLRGAITLNLKLCQAFEKPPPGYRKARESLWADGLGTRFYKSLGIRD